MLNVLVPYDGSRNSLLALRHAIGEYRANHDLRLHLLNVQAPLTRHVARFLSGADRGAWHRQQAEAALKSGRRELERAGVPYETHTTLGERAHEIVQAARRLAAHHIVMGTARKHTLARMFQSSTTAQVLEHTPVPVEVVAGDEVPALERWGLRAGVLASAGGLMMLVLD